MHDNSYNLAVNRVGQAGDQTLRSTPCETALTVRAVSCDSAVSERPCEGAQTPSLGVPGLLPIRQRRCQARVHNALAHKAREPCLFGYQITRPETELVNQSGYPHNTRSLQHAPRACGASGGINVGADRLSLGRGVLKVSGDLPPLFVSRRSYPRS